MTDPNAPAPDLAQAEADAENAAEKLQEAVAAAKQAPTAAAPAPTTKRIKILRDCTGVGWTFKKDSTVVTSIARANRLIAQRNAQEVSDVDTTKSN